VDGVFYDRSGEVVPSAAPVQDRAVGRGHDGRRLHQELVGSRGELDAPRGFVLEDCLFDQSLQTSTVGYRAVQAPQHSGAADSVEMPRDQLDGLSRNVDSSVVPTHGGQVSEGTVTTQQEESVR